MARSNSRTPPTDGGKASGTVGSDFIDPKQLDDTATEITADPSDSGSGGDAQADGPGPKRRKRRGRPPSATTPLSVEGIEGVLLSIHAILAGMTKTPELNLAQTEAKAMAIAIANVARHYPSFPLTQKLQDWFALGTVLVAVYSTRSVAIGIRKKREKGATSKPANGIASPMALWPAARPAPLDEGTKQ